mgnify:CR=1 FL=1
MTLTTRSITPGRSASKTTLTLVPDGDVLGYVCTENEKIVCTFQERRSERHTAYFLKSAVQLRITVSAGASADRLRC